LRVGDVRDLCTEGSGAVVGVRLLVDTGEPGEVPIMFAAADPGVSVGDRPRVGGTLAFSLPNRHEPLLCLRARWIDPVMRAPSPTGPTQLEARGLSEERSV
jgi:hypothetical protein